MGVFLVLAFGSAALAQNSAPPHSQDSTSPHSQSPRDPGESSSKDTMIDISPPKDDALRHPDAADYSTTDSDVTELKPWNPHKAAKNIEVGNYHFKRKNYKAAISRYREALEWKPRDAEATFRLAQALDKNGERSEALASYQDYVKILRNGPFAAEARKAIDRLQK